MVHVVCSVHLVFVVCDVFVTRIDVTPAWWLEA